MSEQPSTKRRRVALACRNCRERKVRCDGVKPICGACRSREYEAHQCVYHVISGTEKRESEREYVRSLRSRLSHLEKHARDTAVIKHPAESHGAVESLYVQHPGPSSSLLLATGTKPVASDEPSSPVTAMGASTPAYMMGDHAGKSHQFYGQPSVISQVRGIVPQAPNSNNHQTLNSSEKTTSRSSLLLDDRFALPPRKTADALLDTYWNRIHVLYPWVHVQSFVSFYNTLWCSGDEGDQTEQRADVGLGGCDSPTPLFYCALNAIFAISCELSDIPPPEKSPTATKFYERMIALFPTDLLDGGSLCHVQTLLLVAQYLQCTHYTTRCWNAVGMAHRMSVGLGLHSNQDSDTGNILEREMKRRIWHGCVQTDLMLSMTMGRPATALLNHNVPLPQAIDDEYLSNRRDCQQPDGTVSRNQFSVENLKLVYILGSILSTVYQMPDSSTSPTSPRDFNELGNKIHELDSALRNFAGSIHPALKWNKQSNQNSNEANKTTFQRQSIILHARFLHLRLLLHRPGLSQFCSNEADSGVKRQGGQQDDFSFISLCQENSALICVRVACQLIDSVEETTAKDATGAWWFIVFYLISAGIVLVLAGSNESLRVKLGEVFLEDSWSKCTRTLCRLADAAHPSARDYAFSLDKLRQHAETRRLRKQPDGPQTTEAALYPGNKHTPEDEGKGHPVTPALEWENSTNSSTMHTTLSGMSSGASPEETSSPLLRTWDASMEDLMFPAHLLQELNDGALLSTFF